MISGTIILIKDNDAYKMDDIPLFMGLDEWGGIFIINSYLKNEIKTIHDVKNIYKSIARGLNRAGNIWEFVDHFKYEDIISGIYASEERILYVINESQKNVTIDCLNKQILSEPNTLTVIGDEHDVFKKGVNEDD